jgi:hypothetical protein
MVGFVKVRQSATERLTDKRQQAVRHSRRFSLTSLRHVFVFRVGKRRLLALWEGANSPGRFTFFPKRSQLCPPRAKKISERTHTVPTRFDNRTNTSFEQPEISLSGAVVSGKNGAKYSSVDATKVVRQ